MFCTCESFRVNVHPLNSLALFSDGQDEIDLIGTIGLGSENAHVGLDGFSLGPNLKTLFPFKSEISVLHLNARVQF